MYELIQLGARTYYIDCPSKVGIYKLTDDHVCLIDSGNDRSMGKKIMAHLAEQGWTLDFIINTHSHADHIGANKLLQDRCGCAVYASDMELPFIQHTILEPSFLYGGAPINELRNKFLEAAPSQVLPLSSFQLPDGLTILNLAGHSPEMIGIRTDDNIAFLADTVASAVTLDKYHLTYLHDVAQFLATLETLLTLDCKFFVPSHTEAVQDIQPLVELNRNKVHEIIALILTTCETARTFEEILQCIFNHYHLRMDVVQYGLIGITTHAYLSYLHNTDLLDISIVDNKLYWSRHND